MAFDRHTVIGGTLVGVIVIACIAGLLITGGPIEARRQKEDSARLTAVSETAVALACYHQAHGSIPADTAQVETELADAASASRRVKGCASARFETDPVTGQPFHLRRDDTGTVTQICAEFATSNSVGGRVRYGSAKAIVPDLREARETPGEHCFALNLDADLD